MLEDPGVPPQDHIDAQTHSLTDSHTPPSRVLLKTIACPFCQTETRKPKSLKRGVSPTSEAVWGSRVGTLAHGGQVYTGIHICVTPAPAYNWRQRLPRLASQKIRYGSRGRRSSCSGTLCGPHTEASSSPHTQGRRLNGSDCHVVKKKTGEIRKGERTPSLSRGPARRPLRAPAQRPWGPDPLPTPPGRSPPAGAVPALTSSSWCWQKPRRSGKTERREKGAPGKGGPSPSCCAAAAAAAAAAGPGGPRSM